MGKTERGQSIIVLILLIIGVLALVAMYMANSRQNFELSSTVGSSIVSFVDEVAEGSAAEQAVWTEAHASRHNKHVLNISSKCNEGTQYTVHMKNPANGRDAYICFVEGYWVITVKQFDPAKIAEWGDDVVTAFARKTAKSVDDVVNYMIGKGWIVQ
jgi:hypothetical protein